MNATEEDLELIRELRVEWRRSVEEGLVPIRRVSETYGVRKPVRPLAAGWGNFRGRYCSPQR